MKPLPLTVFEQYLFHEDRPGFPNSTAGKWTFSGTIDRSALEAAARIAARRHPFLTAQIKKRWYGALYWEFDNTATIPVHWHGEQSTDFSPEFRNLDPTKEVCFECHVSTFEGGAYLFFHQAHVLADGAGSYKAIHDILVAYDNQLGQNRELPEVDIEGLKHRNHYGLTLGKKLKLLPMQILGFFYAIGLLRRKVSPLVPGKEASIDEPIPPSWPHTVSRQLDKRQYAGFRNAARECKSSVNNLCIAYFHTAIGAWREQQGFGEPTDWIRLTVPVGLRSKSDNKLSACNIFSVVSIDRQAKGLANRERLVRRSKEDMDLIQRGWLGLTFLFILWLHNRRPNGIYKMSRRDVCRTSAVITNVGHVYAHSPLAGRDRRLQVTGAKLEKIESTAPYRPHSHATLQLSLYAGAFNMNLNYDARVMTRDQADQLIDCFVQEIQLQTLS